MEFSTNSNEFYMNSIQNTFENLRIRGATDDFWRSKTLRTLKVHFGALWRSRNSKSDFFTRVRCFDRFWEAEIAKVHFWALLGRYKLKCALWGSGGSHDILKIRPR